MYKFYFLLIIIATGFCSFSYSQDETEINNRVKDLISKMTIEEKTSQLNTEYLSGIPRLNIPYYNWHNEALHGLITCHVSAFPTAIALAATFDIPLMYDIATAISNEGRVLFRQGRMGLNYFSPNLDIVRDPRWGRNQETYGEDPYLAARMGVAYCKGMQGDDKKYLKTITSPKHFAVHSGPEYLRFKFDPVVSQRDVWETYMPPFKAAVEEGKTYSVMMGYNAYNGIPASINKYLMTDILRDEWGLRGYVMNDCGGLSIARWNFGFGKDETETAALAIKAGLDLECGEYYYYHLKDAYERGLVTEAEIDTALFRIFKARFKLGLFDDPDSCKYNFIPDSVVECSEHKELALKAARECMVLLKNEDNFLPLSKDIKSIYMVGPNAGQYWEMLGAYHGYPSKWHSTLDGIKMKVDSNTKITHYKGLEIMGMITEFAGSELFKTPDGKPGLKAEYFDNTDLEGDPVMTRIDTAIDFHWERISPITGSPDGEPFSVRWTGTIRLDKGGNYTFSVISNDGARLYIDNKKIVDSWWEHGPTAFIGLDTLQEGIEYPFRLEYFFSESYAHVRLELGSDSTCEDKYLVAMEEAKKHDLVIFVGGLSAQYESEMFDRYTIDLPAGQDRLLKALQKSGVPIVLVLYSGGSLTVNWAEENCPAILQAWYGGQDAGIAVADILFGDYNPSGRLPVTFYKSDDDLPAFEDYSMENRSYRYFRGEPLYPFGYGLSYTTFEYSNLKLPAGRIDLRETDTIDVIYSLKNSGDATGDEVTQLYAVNLTSKLPQPIKQLKGFKRRNLKPGESVRDTIKLVLDELYYYDTLDQKYKVEPGTYELQIASSSVDVRLKGNIELFDNLQSKEEDVVNVTSIKLYPNPAKEFIMTEDLYGEVKIYDVMGKELFSKFVNNYERINITGFPAGIYLLKYKNSYTKFIKI